MKRRTPARDAERQLLENLGVELYARLRLQLTDLGLTPAVQKRALDRAWTHDVAPNVSGPVIRNAQNLSALLLEWTRVTRYLDEQGRPRVLPLYGEGVTFETLAQQFMPDVPLQEVVTMICTMADAEVRSDDKITLLGDVLVNINRSTTPTLALLIRQIDQLLETFRHNAKLTPQQRGRGRMQRVVTGVIPKAQYPSLMRELRPAIADLLGLIDTLIEKHQPQTAADLEVATAISVGVYIAEETDWERAGIDLRAQIRRPIK